MFVLLLCLSITLALYPTISKAINTAFTNSTVDNYSKNVDTMPTNTIHELIQEAETYNAALSEISSTTELHDFDPAEHYNDILSVTNEGIMGSVDIPVINVRLPIYHGTDKEFLDEGAGHLMGSSFPVGGESTHAIISAHTALPGKQFFDKLTEVKKDDVFYISVLDRTLEYKVTNIQVVLPSENQSLSIIKGKDLVTLVTCTPYAINTHRLLVTGERVEQSKELTDNTYDLNTATINSPPITSINYSYVYILIGAIVLLAAILLFVLKASKRKNNREKEK